jgi:hypothetical protein
MKRLGITAIVALLILGSMAWSQRANILKGEVEYDGGGGVGSGKKVYVYFQNPPIKMDVDSTETDGDSWYGWSFYPPVYFGKVRCRFYEDGSWYSGETGIWDTLWGDAQYDITVYEEE